MKAIKLALLVALLVMIGCVKGAIQVGPTEWPSWMQGNTPSTTSPTSQPGQEDEKTIREWLKELL